MEEIFLVKNNIGYSLRNLNSTRLAEAGNREIFGILRCISCTAAMKHNIGKVVKRYPAPCIVLIPNGVSVIQSSLFCQLNHFIPCPLSAFHERIDFTDIKVFLNALIEHNAGSSVLIAEGDIRFYHIQLMCNRKLTYRILVPPRLCKVAVFKLVQIDTEIVWKNKLHFMGTHKENVKILVSCANLLLIGLLNRIDILLIKAYLNIILLLYLLVSCIYCRSDLRLVGRLCRNILYHPPTIDVPLVKCKLISLIGFIGKVWIYSVL